MPTSFSMLFEIYRNSYPLDLILESGQTRQALLFLIPFHFKILIVTTTLGFMDLTKQAIRQIFQTLWVSGFPNLKQPWPHLVLPKNQVDLMIHK